MTSKSNMVIFYRKEGFYPIQFLNPIHCGKTLEQQAIDHADRNPGTLKIECAETHKTLWILQ